MPRARKSEETGTDTAAPVETGEPESARLSAPDETKPVSPDEPESGENAGIPDGEMPDPEETAGAEPEETGKEEPEKEDPEPPGEGPERAGDEGEPVLETALAEESGSRKWAEEFAQEEEVLSGQPKPEEKAEGESAEDAAPRRSRREVMRELEQQESEQAARRREAEQFSSTWAALQSAMHRKTVLFAIVTGLDKVYRKDPHTGLQVGSVLLTAYLCQSADDPTPRIPILKISIPFDELNTNGNPIRRDVDLSTAAGCRQYLNRQVSMARKFFRQVVPVVITHMEKDPGVSAYAIGASRRLAMASLARQNYSPADGGDGPRVKVGDFVEAKIVSVSNHGLLLNIRGVDCRIQDFAATFRYVGDAHKLYSPGQTITVCVQEIRQGADGTWNLTVSGREVELAEARKKIRAGAVQIGSVVSGTFVQIRPSRRFPNRLSAIAVMPEPLNIPIHVNAFEPRTITGHPPMSGTGGTFEIIALRENGFAVANCTGTFESPDVIGRL